MKRKMHRKSLIAAGFLIVLMLPVLLGQMQGLLLVKNKARPEDGKSKEPPLEPHEYNSSARKVHYSTISMVEVSATSEETGETDKGQGRIPFVAKVKGIDAYFRFILSQGGGLFLTKGAGFQVMGKVELKNDDLMIVKEDSRIPSTFSENARDVTSEFASLFEVNRLPFGASRVILLWPNRLANRLQDALKSSGVAKDAIKFYGTIEARGGHLIIALEKVFKKDGTVTPIDQVFEI